MQSIRITSRPALRIKKWNQLSHFRWASTKVIPMEKKTFAGYISTMSQVCFFSRTDPSFFTSISPVLLDRLNKTSWVFPVLNSTSHFVCQTTVSSRSDSSSGVKSVGPRMEPWGTPALTGYTLCLYNSLLNFYLSLHES